MRVIVTIVALLLTLPLFGQLEIRGARSGPDLDDLYTRVSGSAYVIRGVVLDHKLVGRRVPLPKTQVAPNVWRLDPDALDYGTLFTVVIEETVCRQTDFAAAPLAPAPLSSVVQIFVPSEPKFVMRRDTSRGIFQKEDLKQNREYLLFLREAPNQNELVSKYQLDSGMTYYRTYEWDRGAVLLPNEANPEGPYEFVTPLVSVVTAFCEAVKTDDVETKIRQLYAVKKHSPDAAWLKSVEAAIKAFEKPPNSTSPPPPQRQR